MPLCRTHLAWPAEMNWSMMHWAVLWKSPNWASQHTRALGLAMAKPSSNPNAHQHLSKYTQAITLHGNNCGSRKRDKLIVYWHILYNVTNIRSRGIMVIFHISMHCKLSTGGSYPKRRTQTGSCCTLCREPGSPTDGSLEHRSVYQLPDHARRGDGDCNDEATNRTHQGKNV